MTQEILLKIQKNFPMTKKPFEDIANSLGIDENEVINIIKQNKDKKIIRQISAIFDTKALGYNSSLVAFEIPKEQIQKSVEIINAHPGISHNYERNHQFNIWFTLATSPDSSLGLEKTVEILAKTTKAKQFIILPTLKLFKISVKLDTTGKEAKKEKIPQVKKKSIKLTPLHIEIIKLLQNDIKIINEPFADIVNKLDISYDYFFDLVKELQDSKVMRRFAAILNHKKAGFNANAMVVWDINEKKAEQIGKKAAAFSAVSHCYLRPKYPNWPYNLFTMIHGKTTAQVDDIIDDIASEIEYKTNMALYSSREFKKVRLKYFTNDEAIWERNIIAPSTNKLN
jgi:DNA-binding Lrp family transcriptional regulator